DRAGLTAPDPPTEAVDTARGRCRRAYLPHRGTPFVTGHVASPARPLSLQRRSDPTPDAPTPYADRMGKASRRKKETRGKTKVAPAPYTARPFAGLPGEPDWVAAYEILPAATAT